VRSATISSGRETNFAPAIGERQEYSSPRASQLSPPRTHSLPVFSDFFGRDRRLNEKDLGLLQNTIRRMLGQRMQGASAQWQDEETGEAGRISALRLYEQDGTPCAEVEHHFTARSPFRCQNVAPLANLQDIDPPRSMTALRF
jgi:hypothetical protein